MKIDTKEIVILGAVRTPIGTYKGSLKNLDAHKLGSIAIRNLLKKTQTSEKEIEDIVLRIIEETNSSGMKDMGKVMGW